MSSAIRALARHDVNLIQSAQVITTLADAAKELFENAIDAGSTKVSIKFTNYGLDVLEVSDDGSGIPEVDHDSVASHHATSKLSHYEDMQSLTTLGFRGEALSSLAALSNLSITTCTAETYPRGTNLIYDRTGNVKERKSVSATRGTIVKVEMLFESVPVRRKDFVKNAKREMMSAAKLLQAHAAIRTGVRVEAVHLTGKSRTHLLGNNGTTGSNDLKRNASDLFGSHLFKMLVPVDTSLSFQSTHHRRDGQTEIRIHGLLSNLQRDYGQRPERQLTYINARPCALPKVLRVVNEVCTSLGANRQPFALLNLVMPPDSYDVNVSPDKRTIFLHDETVILEHLRDAISNMFSNDSRTIPTAQMMPTKSVRPPVQTITLPSETADDDSQMSVEIDTRKASPLDQQSQSDDESMASEVGSEEVSAASEQTSQGISQLRESLADPVASSKIVQTRRSETHKQHRTLERHAQPYKPEMSGEIRPQAVITSFLKRKREDDNTKRPRSGDSPQAAESLLDRPAQHDVPHDQAVPPIVDTSTPTTGEIEADRADNLLSLLSTRRERFSKRLDRLDRSAGSDHVHNAEDSIDTANIDFSQSHVATDTSFLSSRTDLREAGISQGNETAERTLSLNVSKSDFFDMQVLGQFNLGFILVMLGRELFIVDQHASDEKSNYEKLLRETVIQSQKMARPKELDLSAMERLNIHEHLETFSKNGFEVICEETDSGESRYFLDALPVTKKTTFGATDLLEILHLLMEGSAADSVRCTKARRMFASRACRSSIMIGTALTTEKMQEIIWHLGEMEAPWNCPHGRPTMRHLVTLEDIPLFQKDYR